MDDKKLPRASLGAEEASDGDRVWFERNPEETVRHRALVPGEFTLPDGTDEVEEKRREIQRKTLREGWTAETRVEVKLIAPGVRTRTPWFAVIPPWSEQKKK